MDKSGVWERLAGAAGALGIELSEAAIQDFFRLCEELRRWNAKVNLTAVTEPEQVAERHFLDSLIALKLVTGTTVLDVGSGGGFPGLAWALARPSLHITMVDAVAKKVGFIKSAIATLKLAPRCRALHVRMEGNPAKEGFEPFDTVVSRALMDVGPWLELAAPYVRVGGEVLAMVAKTPERSTLDSLAGAAGLQFVEAFEHALPTTGEPRAALRFVRPE